jgi:hypothetical protein
MSALSPSAILAITSPVRGSRVSNVLPVYVYKRTCSTNEMKYSQEKSKEMKSSYDWSAG